MYHKMCPRLSACGAEGVTLQVACIDRMYLNVYAPKLQTESGAIWFFRGNCFDNVRFNVVCQGVRLLTERV